MGFINTSSRKKGGFGAFTPSKGYKLGTSKGLYKTAQQTGLEERADKILAQKGETNQIFSGGFVSDIFDVMNTMQYGVAGTLQGKGFAEGVKNRASFSDKDQLGKYGLLGTIGGVALDIAIDPLTYVAPWTIAKKIPGIARGAKTISKVAESSKVGQWFGDKFIYMFGKDPVYRNLWEKSVKNIAVGSNNLGDIAKGIAGLSPETAGKILTKDKTGRFMRVGLNTLKSTMKPDEFSKVQMAWNKLDNLGKEAVDLGLLNSGKYEENLGQYIKNAYTEYELKKSPGIFGYSKKKISGIKSRKDLTPEQIAKLGQIDNPAYLLFKSHFDLLKDVENAKFFKDVNKQFGSSVAQEGMKQLPVTQRFITSMGKQTEILSGIKDINQKLKPLFIGLKQTFKADKGVLSEIGRVEKELTELGGKRADELTKFFQEGQKITRDVAQKGVKTGLPLVEKLPKDLFDIAKNIKNGIKYDDIKLEKLWIDGVLERNGFKSIKSFIDYIKKPAEIIPSKIVKTTAVGNIPKIIKLQTDIEKLFSKSSILKEIDKRSINDAFRYLEENISTLTGKKEEFIEQLGKIKLGDLSGKWVPENLYDDLMEITQPIARGTGEMLMGEFKKAKTIMNPATHVRNVISNQILNWWKLGIGPWRQDLYYESIKQMKNGGKWIDEAKSVGYGLNTFASNEIRDLIASPSGNTLGKAKSAIENKLGNLYQNEENFAKLTAFIFQRKKGMGIEDAWKAAESATFNYAQVTPFVRKLRTSVFGYPFITFAMKAAPTAVETALKHPQRISSIGKIKTAIENMSDIKETERERSSEPQWIRDGFYIKLPIKDKHGRSAYFDLTYIIPFGDLVSGSFLTPSISKETGLPEGQIQSALQKSPLLNFISEISKNQDFYGDKLWKDSDSQEKQLGDLFRHLTKTMLPPLVSDQIPGGYMPSTGERRKKGVAGVLTPEENIKQQRTTMQELLRMVGMKIQPIDVDIQETYMEWEKKKALETLLKERGQIKEFKRTYIPKKK